MKFLGLALTLLLLLAGSSTSWAQRNAHEPKPTPMWLPPPDPNAPRWHTIKVAPKAGLPPIHFYDKLNPVWWLGNVDDPVPPNWYQPEDEHRKTEMVFPHLAPHGILIFTSSAWRTNISPVADNFPNAIPIRAAAGTSPCHAGSSCCCRFFLTSGSGAIFTSAGASAAISASS